GTSVSRYTSTYIENKRFACSSWDSVSQLPFPPSHTHLAKPPAGGRAKPDNAPRFSALKRIVKSESCGDRLFLIRLYLVHSARTLYNHLPEGMHDRFRRWDRNWHRESGTR